MWLLSYVSLMIDIFLFLDAPILKLRDISVILPTYRPEIIIPAAFATKN